MIPPLIMMFLKCNFLQICLYDMARCDSNLFWSNFCWDPVYSLPCGADKVHSCLFFISVIPGWRSSGSGDSNVVTTDLRIIPAQCAVVGKHSQYNESLSPHAVSSQATSLSRQATSRTPSWASSWRPSTPWPTSSTTCRRSCAWTPARGSAIRWSLSMESCTG